MASLNRRGPCGGAEATEAKNYEDRKQELLQLTNEFIGFLQCKSRLDDTDRKHIAKISQHFGTLFETATDAEYTVFSPYCRVFFDLRNQYLEKQPNINEDASREDGSSNDKRNFLQVDFLR